MARSAARRRPRRVAAAEPLAAALLDHQRDGRPRRVTALRADGLEFEIETEEYFTLEGELASLDRIALERARGRVLDVGAGAGRHALALQAKGCEVVAIDVSPVCVALCQARGVREARVVDVMALVGAGGEGDALGRFDTILFGMQTIGVAGSRAGLRALLVGLRSLLRPGGCILADSSALRFAWEGDTAQRDPRDDVRESGAIEDGVIVLETRYGRMRGEPFAWLYLAEDDLAHAAREAGYAMETLGRVEGGEYLAALRVDGHAASEAVEP